MHLNLGQPAFSCSRQSRLPVDSAPANLAAAQKPSQCSRSRCGEKVIRAHLIKLEAPRAVILYVSNDGMLRGLIKCLTGTSCWRKKAILQSFSQSFRLKALEAQIYWLEHLNEGDCRFWVVTCSERMCPDEGKVNSNFCLRLQTSFCPGFYWLVEQHGKHNTNTHIHKANVKIPMATPQIG